MKKKITKKFKGFTLIELLICIGLIFILASISLPGLLSQIPEYKTKQDIKIVEQALKQGRSIAVKKSANITVDFTGALSNNGENGGIIALKDSNNNTLKTLALNKNVKINNLSTVLNNKVVFDYRGQPLGEDGTLSSFDNSTNKVIISYFDGNIAKYSQTLTISPMTGSIEK